MLFYTMNNSSINKIPIEINKIFQSKIILKCSKNLLEYSNSFVEYFKNYIIYRLHRKISRLNCARR